MYPHERSLVKQLADKPFAIVGVNSDKESDNPAEVCVEKNLSWKSFKNVQPDGTEISDDWEVKGWPTLYILDAQGVVRYANSHFRSGNRNGKIDAAITELLAEMGHDVKLGDH